MHRTTIGFFLRIGLLFGTQNGFAQTCELSWISVGPPGMDNTVRALAAFDDGVAAKLYATGNFLHAGSAAVNSIAVWNGMNWAAVGSGITGGSGVKGVTLATFDDGTGSALYAGGYFSSAGGVSTGGIARWNGSAWSVVGQTDLFVHKLVATQQASAVGPALYAGGSFSSLGNIARWNGNLWTGLRGGTNGIVESVFLFDDGRGMALYAGGRFSQAGGQTMNYVAKWDGTTWSPLGSGMAGGTAGLSPVYALASYNDGTGNALFVGGDFTQAGGTNAAYIAKWNGRAWSPLGAGMNAPVWALRVYDDGAGPMLYAAGNFTIAGGATANRIAKWSGVNWMPVGTGTNGTIFDMHVFNNGAGAGLYACGTFTSAGGQPANRIAVWKRTAPPQDINCDGHVNVNDLLAVINHWGRCPPQPYACPGDINGDGNVNTIDLLAVINNWG